MRSLLLGVVTGAALMAAVLNAMDSIKLSGNIILVDANAASPIAPPPGAQAVGGAWCHLISQGNPALFEREVTQYYAAGAQVVSYVYNNVNTALICYRPS
jgi:hypothetical protein